MKTVDLRKHPTYTINSLEDVEKHHTTLLGISNSPWLFRGEKDGTLHLDSSLGRVLSDYQITSDRLEYEKAMKKQFERVCHLYADLPVLHRNTLTYLTLMRHYGAPTRLLDWTYSYYVALFFATEAMDLQKQPIVYALNAAKLDEAVAVTMKREGLEDPSSGDRYYLEDKTFEDLFWSACPKRFVCRLNSFDLLSLE